MKQHQQLKRRAADFCVRPGLLLAVLAAISLAVSSLLTATANAQSLEYNRDIRPILADACFACHGPDSAAREADLRLDQRAAAIEAGALQPGEPDESELIRRILSMDSDEIMPPQETKKTLTAAQKQKLVQWVRDGAEYQLHWSFLPPQRTEPPAVKQTDWVRNPIDRFIAAKREKAGLAPAEEADRRTLARRVSLDLTGAPPEPALVERFVADPAADAYEQLVDRLLESKHWGEHRGRYWLDYARYADTHGIHFDNYREMWSYRDWVIDAFNENMPFSQFTIENLAGDLLPNRTLAQQIGSGFNRCNMTTNEGGIIDEEYLVLYTRDRTETTSQVWLGLTTGCAVCHSHKFDPLSQREFYAMAAFFNNSTQRARDGNVHNTPPMVVVPDDADRGRHEQLPALIAAAKTSLQTRRSAARKDFRAWLVSAGPEALEVSNDALYLRAALDEGEGRTVHVQVDQRQQELPLSESSTWREGPPGGKALQVQGAVCELADVGDFPRDQPLTLAAWIQMPANDGYGSVCSRMDNDDAFRGWDFWVQRRQFGIHIVNAWPGNALKVVGKSQVPTDRWVHVAVTYDGSSKASGIKVYYDGKPQATNVEADKLSATIKTSAPFKIGQRKSGSPFNGGLQDLRVYRRSLAPAEVKTLAKLTHYKGILAQPDEQRTDRARNELYDFWLSSIDEGYLASSQHLAALEKEQQTIAARGTIAHVMQEKPTPPMAHVLYRGEYDQRREQVSPDTPAVLPPFPEGLPRNRLGFAQWLLLPEHPLTARVTVNRFWQEVFGVGIVKSTGDFGVAGELPSHPKLLDWLAVDFRESGWDVKRLFKLMVTSAAYRQSAKCAPEKLEKDPENRLLARGPRFRMDAEMVRDYALSASGLLVNRLGGPSVKPYQPPGVWEAIAMNVSNTRSYRRGTGDDLYRRSMYTFVKRMAPPASLEIFNAPNREVCAVRRERTNTPLQALVTLNDEQFVEAARHLAQRAILEGGESFEERARFISLRLLSRGFRDNELPIVKQSFQDLSDFYQDHRAEARKLIAVGESKADPQIDPATLAAWTMLANQLMNLDEVLNK